MTPRSATRSDIPPSLELRLIANVAGAMAALGAPIVADRVVNERTTAGTRHRATTYSAAEAQPRRLERLLRWPTYSGGANAHRGDIVGKGRYQAWIGSALT
jgi:hypothetical protein